MNKYLEKVAEDDFEKTASFIGAGIAAHLAQNLGTHFALKNKHVGKYLANSFAAGTKGVSDHSVKSIATRAGMGVVLPDVAVAHKSANELGRAMRPMLEKATPRQKVGLRMLSQGRIGDIRKYGLHDDPVIHQAHAMIKKHVPGLPTMDHLLAHGDNVKKVFSDPSHPLLSNISKNISRGKVPTGSAVTTHRQSAGPSLAGALTSAVVEPASGILNTVKSTMASDAFSKSKYGSKISGMIRKHLVEQPIKEGLTHGGLVDGIKHKIMHFGVNPVSANLKRTSAALADVRKTTL